MNLGQQWKPFYQPMIITSEYLDNLYYYLGGSYPITNKNNQLHLCIQDSATRTYFAELMIMKRQEFAEI